jgi:septal ring factor EnvC (AmiA/AmiB activator)
LDSSSTEKDKLLSELKEKKSVAMETEKKLKKAVDEKEKLQAIIKENNQELKAMECTLTGEHFSSTLDCWWLLNIPMQIKISRHIRSF